MKAPYHHGDLRTALVEAGLRLLASRDIEALSLREVARAAGVSANAVYRHFPDKTALMAALARAGLERLGAAQRDAAGDLAPGGAALAATGRAYIRFALENPALFRLIFSASAQSHAAGDTEASRRLHANVAARRLDRASPEEVGADALRAWALVHGLAMLMLDGQLPTEDGLIDALIRA